MVIAIWASAFLAAVLHIVFFLAESVLWRKPAVRKGFSMSREQAETTRLLAFNQGFYNLLLAGGMLAGLALWAGGYEVVGLTLLGWNGLSMLIAGVVLMLSAPELKRGAVAQALPPAVLLVLLAVWVQG